MSYPNNKKSDEMYAKLHLSEERIELLRQYFEAANNFYQLIPLKRLLRIINSQNSEHYSEEDFLNYAEITQCERHFFDILGEDELFEGVQESKPIYRLLVHESLLEFDDYMELYSEKEGRPYYVPEKDKLLAYADEYYIEHTPQYLAMCDFFRPMLKNKDDEALEEIMSEILFIIKSENSDPYEAQDMLSVTFKTISINQRKMPEFVSLYCDLHNNTRLPCLNCFTPNEWIERTGNKNDSRYIEPEDF